MGLGSDSGCRTAPVLLPDACLPGPSAKVPARVRRMDAAPEKERGNETGQQPSDETSQETEEPTTYGDPGAEVGAAGPSFLPALANVLTHMASLAGRPQRVTRFHAIKVPQLSIRDYLARISVFFRCSPECFVLALIYIDRIVKLHPAFTISVLNIHRLLVTSVMLAAKFFDDVYYPNSYYAKVGGVRTQELNALEAQFLRLIEYKLHVLPSEYDQYRNHVLMAVSGEQSSFNSTQYQQPTPETPWRSGECQPGQEHGATEGLRPAKDE